jgi:CBS domain-containing protein
MHACEPVSRFMTEAVLSIDVRSPAGDILRLFMEYRVHHLPVVDQKKVVGMLSFADLLKLEACLPKAVANPLEYLNQCLRIDQVMQRPPITIRNYQSMESAATLMATHAIHALPVTDADDNLLGIITTTDIMYAVLRPERRETSPSEATLEHFPLGIVVSSAQMQEALLLAFAAVDAEDDRAQVARALLHTRSRLKVLEDVLSAADRYIRAGQDERLHALLVRAIDRARAGLEPPDGK